MCGTMPSFGDYSPCILTTNVFLLPFSPLSKPFWPSASPRPISHNMVCFDGLRSRPWFLQLVSWHGSHGCSSPSQTFRVPVRSAKDPRRYGRFARSVCVGLVGVFALVAGPDRLDATTLGERVAILAVGCAVASAIFVLPEAITWPPASKALLARVDAHTSNTSAPNNS